MFPAKNQPKSHILFHKNDSLRNFYYFECRREIFLKSNKIVGPNKSVGKIFF